MVPGCMWPGGGWQEGQPLPGDQGTNIPQSTAGFCPGLCPGPQSATVSDHAHWGPWGHLQGLLVCSSPGHECLPPHAHARCLHCFPPISRPRRAASVDHGQRWKSDTERKIVQVTSALASMPKRGQLSRERKVRAFLYPWLMLFPGTRKNSSRLKSEGHIIFLNMG